VRCKRHDPPLTVLAEEELPVLADPVESDADPVLEDVEDDEADGVVVVPVVDVTDEVDTVLVDVPACASAAATPSAATATPPTTPKDTVSLRRSRSARSRSSTVMRRLGAGINGPPEDAPPVDATGRGPWA
jgi:hypothetical protein